MKTRAPRIAFPVLLLLVLLGPALPAAADSGAASVRAVIEDEEARFSRAEVRRDAEAMSEMYRDASAGRESAARRLERVAAAGGTLVDERFEISNLEVCDDIAVESGQTVAQFDFPGKSRSVERMRYLSVWKRGPDGGWKVARDLWIAAGTPAAPPTAVGAAMPPVPAPAAVSPPPDAVPIPDARGLSDGFVRNIQDDLKSTARHLRSLASADAEKRRRAAEKADRALQAVIRDVGWIDVGRFGVAASCSAAYVVSQSGDLPLMRATLPLMERDLNHAENDPSCYETALKAYQSLAAR
jgi:ketosteroid isomerase-like protein